MSLDKGILAGLALGVACLTITSQPAEAGVVVSSSGPSAGQFPVGRQIGDSERITLRAGDSITVLDDAGTRVLRGAGTFVLARQSGASRNRAFASLTTQRSATRARTGAVRNAGVAEVSNPNLWYVDVASSGKVCLPGPEDVRLWRAVTESEDEYSIVVSGDAGSAQRVTFPEGEMLAVWNTANPPRENTTYTIGLAPEDQASQIEFAFIGEPPATPEDLAAALIDNGCTTQLELMSSAMMGG